MKNQKGVTLVALVVTIVILIILSVISVGMLMGENGIITATQASKIEQKAAEYYEQVNLVILEKEVTKQTTGEDYTASDVCQTLIDRGYINTEDFDIEDISSQTIAKQMSSTDIDPTATQIKVTEKENNIELIIKKSAGQKAGTIISANGKVYSDTISDSSNNNNSDTKLDVTVNTEMTEEGLKVTVATSNDSEVTEYKYKIGTDGEWITSTSNTHIFIDVDQDKEYEVFVQVIDKNGKTFEEDNISNDNSNNNEEATTPESDYLVDTVSVGDFVSYDAGIWDATDFTLITGSTGSPTVNKTISLPTTQGQFGGFALGSSRNNNSTPYLSTYPAAYTGWRVWSKSGTGATGTVTLVHAGHSETYYHGNGKYSPATTNILQNRIMSMYTNNEYGNTAWFMTGEDYATWYNTNISNTGLTLTDLGGASGLYGSAYKTSNTMLLLAGTDNSAFYWLATSYNESYMYYFKSGWGNRYVDYDLNKAYGVRPLVTLNSGVQNLGGDASSGWTLAI